MTYADTLLADGERILVRHRQHWLALLIEGREALALVVAGVVLGFVREAFKTQLIGAPYDVLGWAAFLLVILGLLWFGYRFLGWRAQEYLVTSRRVLKVDGIVNKRAADSSLEKINDAVLTQHGFARVFGYGDLEIMTAAETEVDVFTMLAGVQDFKREMLNAKYALETDIARPGVATPPLRAQDMTPEAATELLARLGQLHDSGKLTDEEYEAKKRDLLARI
jgi:PH (Pleckstrin Homology) domain-containing protein/putative oligomerization/nucleic acid binding protein